MNSLSELDGRRVGVQAGGVVKLVPILKRNGAVIVEYENDTMSFAEHLWGKTDFVAAETKVGELVGRTICSGVMRTASDPIGKTSIVCLLHKDDTELLSRINGAIEQMSRKGALDKPTAG